MKELSGNQQILIGRPGAKLHHVAQADTSLPHATPSMDLLYEGLGKRVADLPSRHGNLIVKGESERRRSGAEIEEKSLLQRHMQCSAEMPK